MQEFKFSEVQEGYTDKLSLFDPPKQETAILDETRTRYFPHATISHGSPISFSINPDNPGYLDGAKTTMTVKMKITTDAGAAVKATDKVALANLSLYTIFSQVIVTYSGQDCNPYVGNNYAYRNYFDLLLTQTAAMKKNIGLERGYYKDSEGAVKTVDPSSTESPNNGLTNRYKLTSKGQSVTMTGPLGVDHVQSLSKYLLNGVPISLTFYQASDAFRLLSPDEDAKFRLEIEEMYITVVSVKVRPEVLIKNAQLLSDNHSALYAYPKSCIRTHVIPSGSSQFAVSQLLSDRVPSFMAVGLVHADAYGGQMNRNPYLLEHFKCNRLSLMIDSAEKPYD